MEVNTNFIEDALHRKSLRRQPTGRGQGGVMLDARCGGHYVDLVIGGPPIKCGRDDGNSASNRENQCKY